MPSLPWIQSQRCLHSWWHLEISCCNFGQSIQMRMMLTFYSPWGGYRHHCGIIQRPYLILRYFLWCCNVTWAVKEPFLDFWLRWFCLESLISSPISLSQLTISLNPIGFVHLLRLLSWATPLDETTITSSFCFMTLCTFKPQTHAPLLPYSRLLLLLHAPATRSYTSALLTDVIWIHHISQKHPLLEYKVSVHWCIANSCTSSKTAASSPPGSAPTFITLHSMPGGCLHKSSFP